MNARVPYLWKLNLRSIRLASLWESQSSLFPIGFYVFGMRCDTCRPQLMHHHDYMLKLDGEGGWNWSVIDKSSIAVPVNPTSVVVSKEEVQK